MNEVVQLLVRNDHHRGIGMLHDVSVFLRVHGSIYRYMHHSGHGHAHVHKIPLGPVVGDCHDFVPFFKTQLQQSQGKLVGYLIVFL